MDFCDILIVTNSDSFSRKFPVDTIKVLSEFLKDRGYTLAVQVGSKYQREARAVLNHVDLTETPPEYKALFQNYKIGINTNLVNIRKSVVCDSGLLSNPKEFGGPVIVKTDLNFGGMPELVMLKRRGNLPSGGFKQKFPDARFLDPNSYPIFEDSSKVPSAVWDNPNLVVQKLYAEQDHLGRYCLRSWYVLGDRGFHVMTVADHPVVKGRNILDRWVIDVSTPQELLDIKRKLGMDYGRFDYTLYEGKAAVFDANRTPTSSLAAVSRYQSQWQEMAYGIEQYLAAQATTGKENQQ